MNRRTAKAPICFSGSLLPALIPLFFLLGCAAISTEPSAPPPYAAVHKIDIHAHIFESSIDPSALADFAAMFRANNVSIVNVCNRGRDGSLETMHRIARDMHSRYPALFPFASSFDLTQIENPNYTNQVLAWLDNVYRDGAVMTKIWKEVGMEVRRPDGTFILPDDPIFDPIYEYLARHRKPLMAHIGDPIDGWLPLGPASPHYSYFSSNPQFHLYGKTNFPTHAQLIAARDHILQKHPRLIVIGAHFGSLEHDLDQVAARLDRYPNFYIDCAARTRDLTYQSRDKVRNFFIKYQDRILYGVDMTWKPFAAQRPPTPQQRANFIKSLEQKYQRDYAYYSGNGPLTFEGRQTQALALPNTVLQKIYRQNAERLVLHSSP